MEREPISQKRQTIDQICILFAGGFIGILGAITEVKFNIDNGTAIKVGAATVTGTVLSADSGIRLIRTIVSSIKTRK